MRRRRFRIAALAAALAVAAPHPVLAQSGIDTEGALFLLLPVGARAVGLGQAMAAENGGTEAVWWNPSAIARSRKREAAIHHSQDIIATGDAVSILIPSSLLGVLAASVNILNYGGQDITEPSTGTKIGSVLPRSLVYVATYATSIGPRFNAGLNFKVVQVRVDCSGDCTNVETISASTSAVDMGMQYDLEGHAPVTLGLAVRNVGLRLQVKDKDQSDPLPTRVQMGVVYRLPPFEVDEERADLHVSADVLAPIGFDDPSARLGMELSWQETVHLRGGYVFDASERAGPAIGIGLAAGGFTVDLARVFEGFSADAGEAPVYLSLRYLF